MSASASRLLRIFLLVSAVLVVASPLRAQIVIYRLSFEKTGDSINYRPYQNGFYIAPVEGGTGSLILTLVTGNLRQFFVFDAFGELFVAVKGDTRKMVFSATAANNVSTTVFHAIGTADKTIEVESRNAVSQVKVAAKMTGVAVSADSERDLPFSATDTSSVGVAGMSILTAKFDQNATEVANRDNNDVNAQVDIIILQLQGTGYVNGQPSTGGGGGGTGGGTAVAGGAGAGAGG